MSVSTPVAAGAPADPPASQPDRPDRRPGRQADRPAGRRPATRWRRHWYRLVIPFGLLALLIGGTLTARAMEDPDLAEAATLAPAGTGPDGSSELAAMLTARGVTIQPVSTFEQAEQALRAGGDAVVFVPKPTMAGAGLVAAASRSFARHRVVLVAPSAYDLLVTGLPVAGGPQRWAARAVPPGATCTLPEATRAGVATALRNRYSSEDGSCYQGGLARVRTGRSETYVVGASDPFRNSRIHEHGNATLAVELLTARDRVIWADALPVNPNFRLPSLSRPPVDRTPGGSFAALVQGYPPAVLMLLALLAVLAVLVAMARGRRLGPPVPEPLPVLVPSVEAVIGRGRLYQRTRGRAAALAALRAAAMPKLISALGLPAHPPPAVETVVEAAARRTGAPVEQVRRTLIGAAPEDDQALVHAVAALDALVAAVRRDNPTGRMVS